MSTTEVDAIVLAAGGSSRLGQSKQLLSLHGLTLVARAAAAAFEAVDGDVHVVLGAEAEACRARLEKLAVRPHICSNWADGQHASLRFGLDCVTPDRAVLVVLTDQYRIGPKHLRRLIDAWRDVPGRPAAASYDDVLGAPVVWPANYVQRLRATPRGQRLLDRVSCTAVPMAAAAFDLDTPEQLRQMRKIERAGIG